MIVVRAPGRVNLMGEHTDTSGGLVLPAAIDRYVTLEASATPDGSTRLVSDTLPGETRITPSGILEDGSPGWGRYVAAVHQRLLGAGHRPAGVEGVVRSTVPPGAGLSSSAALEVALGLAFVTAAGGVVEPRELALLCQAAEHLAVGVPCGPMDQLASALGVAGHALRIDCGTLEVRPVPLPKGVGIVVVDSGIRRQLERTPYAVRHAELLAGDARRTRHVRTENERVDEVCRLLGATRLDGAALGDAFSRGHASLRDDFEVSLPELDRLVELLLERGALAARLTGAGFGGSVVALAEAGSLDRLGESAVEAFRAETGLPAIAHVCRAVDGAALVEARL